MDSAAAQLRVVDGLVPAEGSGVHVADLGAGQRKPGGRGRRLVAEDAEEPGPDERASAPGGIGHRRGNGDGHRASDRRRRAGRAETGGTAGSTLPQEQGGDCRAIERALAGGSLVQPASGIEDVRQHPGADHRLREGDSAQAGGDGAGGVPGTSSAEGEESKERASDPEAWGRAYAPSFVPDERSGSDGDRRNRGGNGTDRTQ